MRAPASPTSGSSTRNSSPPQRIARSDPRCEAERISEMPRSTRSPTACPARSLMFLNRSMSNSTRLNGEPVRRARATSRASASSPPRRLASAVTGSVSARRDNAVKRSWLSTRSRLRVEFEREPASGFGQRVERARVKRQRLAVEQAQRTGHVAAGRLDGHAGVPAQRSRRRKLRAREERMLLDVGHDQRLVSFEHLPDERPRARRRAVARAPRLVHVHAKPFVLADDHRDQHRARPKSGARHRAGSGRPSR